MTSTRLTGITWNHSRALPPLVATAQRYEELNPGVRIVWEKRTLHEFGHSSLAELTGRYDLLVIDHPMMGEAAANLVDLRCIVAVEHLEALSDQFVGQSFASYQYEGGLFALPIDAAAPAASYRRDLLERADANPPEQWSEMLDLASRGLVRMPGFPADLFLNWMGLCVSRADTCVKDPERLLNRSDALASLEALRELAAYMPDSIFKWNPIALYEAMSSGVDFAYCPFAYTSSNYSRPGFSKYPIQFAQSPSPVKGISSKTVLGGTGIAISRNTASLEHAMRYALFVANPEVQRDLYGIAGGQPAARTAWEGPLLNRLNDNFFLNTRASIEAAYVRPRYRGYIALQEAGGLHLAQHLRGHVSANAALDAVDQLYRDSLSVDEMDRRIVEASRHA